MIGPERSVITSAAGLIRSLEGACTAAQITMSRAELRAAVSGGTARLTAILQTIAGDAAVQTSDAEVKQKMPALVLPIEQGEELFSGRNTERSEVLSRPLRDLLSGDEPAIIVVFTIRSETTTLLLKRSAQASSRTLGRRPSSPAL